MCRLELDLSKSKRIKESLISHVDIFRSGSFTLAGLRQLMWKHFTVIIDDCALQSYNS